MQKKIKLKKYIITFFSDMHSDNVELKIFREYRILSDNS
jgi:hypothetical protein